uniref:ACC deaminase n=1 Tax=Pseudomonas plecoglossicida TaxID=70775 RepID=A0MNN0_PSEDL|nr:ACC deaminase [Pseudomonas plecoglossicida]
MNLNRFKRYPLRFDLPYAAKRPSEHLGGKVELYAKREDCNSGLAFGGNKTRNPEARIPEAIEQGCDTLVSIGGIQSNQTRQVAAQAARTWAPNALLVQENWVNYSDAVYNRVGNIKMSRIRGADVRLDSAGFNIGIRPSWEQAMADVRAAGGKPFPIPAGCSEHPYGGLGFVGFAEEVRQQEAELGFKFDYIVVCSVTGSTQAGMVVGFAADGRAQRVIGVDASAKPEQTKAQILRIARHTAKLVDLGREITEKDVVLDTRFAYPRVRPAQRRHAGSHSPVRSFWRACVPDPVYTRPKSMQRDDEMVRRRRIPGRLPKVLYAHLGATYQPSAVAEQ